MLALTQHCRHLWFPPQLLVNVHPEEFDIWLCFDQMTVLVQAGAVQRLRLPGPENLSLALPGELAELILFESERAVVAGRPLVDPSISTEHALQCGASGAEVLPYRQDRVVVNEDHARLAFLGVRDLGQFCGV